MTGQKRPTALEASINLRRAQLVEKQAQEDLRIAAKHARGEALTDQELISLSYLAVGMGMATPEQKLVVLTVDAWKALNTRMIAAFEELEKKFAATMVGEIDECFAVHFQGDDFHPAAVLPQCQQGDFVMILPSPNEKPGIELFLGDLGSKIGILESEQAAEISRQITEGDRKWAGCVMAPLDAIADQPPTLVVMLYRVAPARWDELMAAQP
jgi:hypothetical protein